MKAITGGVERLSHNARSDVVKYDSLGQKRNNVAHTVPRPIGWGTLPANLGGEQI